MTKSWFYVFLSVVTYSVVTLDIDKLLDAQILHTFSNYEYPLYFHAIYGSVMGYALHSYFFEGNNFPVFGPDDVDRMWVVALTCVAPMLDLKWGVIPFVMLAINDLWYRYNSIMLHHVATVTLIYMSWVFRYMDLGIFVLFVHYISDIPMYELRALRRRTTHQFYQLFWIFLTLSSWGYFRIYLMGRLVYQLGRLVYQLGCVSIHYHGGVVCVTMLSILWAANFYWVLKILYKFRREIIGTSPQQIDGE